jgi:nitroreductase
MELYEAIRTRRSVRSFDPRPVPREALDRMLEAARQAPSANNLMPWRFVVVSDHACRKAIAESGVYGRFLANSPVVIVACGDAVLSPEWYGIDTAIALEHIALAAAAEGLGSCWIGSFDEKTVTALLRVPKGQRIVALLAIGYPKDGVDRSKMANEFIHPAKGIDEIACEGSFDRPWKTERQIHP